MTGAAVAKYEWTLNGKGAVTTEEYEVPADAKSGDKIKLVVTAEDGETAEDTVYVGGFTILKVEPTTDATLNGYKYIRAYFSSALTSLAPEDIELRSKDTEQLYSIDTVKLSSDGTYADITLFGSVNEGNTMFLTGGEIYVMAITNNEVFDSYEFELPIFYSNVLVKKVDISKGKVTLVKVLEDGDDADTNPQIALVGEYEVGDVYEGNLGTLVGRFVSVGVNSDNELEKITVRKADVVYGVMKYVNKDNNGANISSKDYFEDQVTKTKYYMTTTGTSSITPSTAIEVVSGDDLNAILLDQTSDYVKLVLNPNGTVACAVMDPFAWLGGTVKVADVDGTIVDETSKTSVDFDGYTIEKNGEYVTTADLEEDDIIFFNGNDDNKFAEVYNNVVTGEPSDIDSTSIKIDGTSYKWNAGDNTIVAAKYYNADDDVYTELMAGATEAAQTVAGQKVLNNFDPDLGVTAYLDRRGNISYIEGTDKESEVTTDTWYVTTSAGEGYSQALTDYLKFKVSDGTEQTIEIPASQIKKLNGVKGKIARLATTDTYPTSESTTTVADEGTGADGGAEGGTYTFSFVPEKAANTADAFNKIPASDIIEQGVLVKVTRDENGKVIGLTFPGFDETGDDAYDWIDTIDGKNSNGLTASSAKVTTDGASKAQLTPATNIWVYTVDHKGAVKVTKTAFADYNKATYALNATATALAPANPGATGFGPFVLLKGSSVTDVLLRETLIGTNDLSDTFTDGETETTEGIIVGYTEKLNADKDGNFVNTITVKDINGVDTTYETADESITTNPGKGVYAEIDLDKATGKIADVRAAWDAASPETIHAIANTSTSTEIHTDGGELIKLAPDSLVLKWTGSKYTAMKLNQIAASTKDLVVVWHDEYYNADEENALTAGTGVHYADFVVVEETTIVPAATVTLSSLAGKKTIAADAQIGTVTENDSAAAYALMKSANGSTGWTTVAGVGLNVAADGKLTVDATWSLHDEYYAVFVDSSDPTGYDDAESNVVKADDAVLDLNNIPATTISRTTTTSGEATTGTSAFAFVDQYGDAITITALTNKTLDAVSGNTGNATGTLSVTAGGIANVTMSNGDTPGSETLEYVDDGNGLTWTVSGTAGAAGSAEVAWTISVAKTL